jgi:hypothetical protein
MPSTHIRDEADRLHWAEQQIRRLITAWGCDADEIRISGNPAADEIADTMDKCALQLSDVLDASQVAGGPPVDHLAEALHHLTELKKQ